MVNYTRKDAEISIASIRQDPWVLIIEVNKKDVKNISQVQLIKKWEYNPKNNKRKYCMKLYLVLM